MSLSTTLKESTLNLLSLIRSFKKEQLASDLDKIIKNDFDELTKDDIYSQNFLELVSYVYAHEQLLNKHSDKENTLSVGLFDKEFISKLELLRNIYAHNTSISR